MSANAESIQDKNSTLSATLSKEFTQPFSGSKKIYVRGSRDDINVGMREVVCANTSI